MQDLQMSDRSDTSDSKRGLSMRNVLIATAACLLLVHLAAADIFDDLPTYTYGANPNTAEGAMNLLQDTPVEQHAAIEGKLIAVVASKDATQDGKAFACRMLQQIGTEACIPAVSGLLGDEVMSHYARLVLQRLATPAAAAALRDALAKAPDPVKVGILGSIGELRDVQAVKGAAELAGSRDGVVAAAAMAALGKIGTAEAAKALTGLTVGDAQRQAHNDALIACAKHLGGADAVPLYEKLLADRSSAHRVAAMLGLAAADSEKGAAVISGALKGDEPKLVQGAISAVTMVPGEVLTKAVAAMIGELSPARQARLITALGARGDRAALDALAGYLKSETPEVRAAAVEAMGKLGDGATVKVLMAAASGDDVQQVKDVLSRMPGADVDEALVAALADDGARTLAIQLLAARNCRAAAPELLELVRSPDAGTRKEAWAALGALGGEASLEPAVKAALAVRDPGELRGVGEALKRMFAAVPDRDRGFAVAAAAYGQASDAMKALILELGAAAGTDGALALERQALKSEDADLRKAALRALASWPDGKPADELLAVATSSGPEAERILALRGYIGLAASSQVSIPGGQRIAMLQKAGELAKRRDEKTQIISGLQQTRNAVGLPMLMAYVADPEVKKEAEMAAVNLLWETRRRKSPEGEQAARALQASDNKGVADKAKRVLGEWNKKK
jgi:HEAT repeat protein